MMALIKDYFCKTDELVKEYGSKSIVFMQVGAFYEVYGHKNIATGIISGSDIEAFASICGFSIGQKKTIEGIVIAGFPDYQIEKYIDIIQEQGYTCAVYSQDGNHKNTTRSLDIICSPGTHFSNNTNQLSNHIMCVWIYNRPPSRLHTKAHIIFGLSVVDVFNGSSHYEEILEEYSHNPTTYNEIERYYSIYQPNEILFVYNSKQLEIQKLHTIIQYIDVTSKKNHLIDLVDSDNILSKSAKRCEKQTYQQETFQQYFSITDISAFVESNRFNENRIGCQSFCFLLNFIYAHNPGLLRNIQQPSIEIYNQRMLLANHSLTQLNILNDRRSTGKVSSVVEFINCAITPMGKRETKRQLLHPVTNIDWLERQYRITQHIITHMNEFEDLRVVFHTFHDIPRYYRKIVLRKCIPIDCSVLYDNIHACGILLQRIKRDELLFDYLSTEHLQESIDTLLQILDSRLDLDVCKQSSLQDIKQNIFKRGVHKHIDELNKKYMETNDMFKAIQQYFSNVIFKTHTGKRSIKGDPCKIHTTEKSGNYLKVSKSRVERLKQKLPKQHELSYSSSYDNNLNCFILNCDIELNRAIGTDKRISNEQIDKIAFSIITSKESMQEAIKKEYEKLLNLLETYGTQIECVSNFVMELDVIFHKAYLAYTYNYCEPIIDVESNSSYFDATQMRHALIEQFQSDEVYIANDIQLGKDADNCVDSTNGILLYGTNAVGKSCLIKSIGICVILAQSGFFVPCSTFIYKPFKHIFTRLLGNDNIFKGLSTFAVEMTELNTILRHSNEDSLILGDELCSGTELGSAISIFAAGLIHLSNNKSKFIFASHFHEIASMEQIIDIQTLVMKHMSVSYNEEEDCLVYDRILEDGPGSNNYGLEVCKSLHLPVEFIELAHTIRIQKQPETKSVLMNTVSHFNAAKVHGKCEICKQIGVDVHHLEPQKYEDARGYIKTFHKNVKGNLVNVCKACHIKQHSCNKQYRRKKTTKGYKILET